MDKLFQRARTLALSKRQNAAARLLKPEGFLQLTADEVERAARYNRPLSVALLQVGRLKHIRMNDGDNAAEMVFADITARAIHMIRSLDRACRLGPEELGILMPESGQKHAEEAMQRLSDTVRGAEIETPSGPRSVTLAVGVAALSARHRDPKALLMAAYVESQRADSQGGDTICVAPPDLATVTLPRSNALH